MRLRVYLFVLAGAVVPGAGAQGPQPPKGGVEFQGAEIREMQRDAFGNPGLLWVVQGEAMWKEPHGEAGASCASCHGDAAKGMAGVATRYPAFSGALGRVVNLEQRINACVTANQRAPAWPYESRELLSLTAFVARQSAGMPIAVNADGPARAVYERGRQLFFERQGQLHLACAQCHDANWGRTLLAERISQGHPADWPAYRLEWQTMGSLQRRLRACYFGIRAAQPPFGADDLVALELYLARRAEGLVTSPPGVRR